MDLVHAIYLSPVIVLLVTLMPLACFEGQRKRKEGSKGKQTL